VEISTKNPSDSKTRLPLLLRGARRGSSRKGSCASTVIDSSLVITSLVGLIRFGRPCNAPYPCQFPFSLPLSYRRQMNSLASDEVAEDASNWHFRAAGRNISKIRPYLLIVLSGQLCNTPEPCQFAFSLPLLYVLDPASLLHLLNSGTLLGSQKGWFLCRGRGVIITTILICTNITTIPMCINKW
jgi:hypothetical protein